MQYAKTTQLPSELFIVMTDLFLDSTLLDY
jgi:hypothetical protein